MFLTRSMIVNQIFLRIVWIWFRYFLQSFTVWHFGKNFCSRGAPRMFRLCFFLAVLSGGYYFVFMLELIYFMNIKNNTIIYLLRMRVFSNAFKLCRRINKFTPNHFCGCFSAQNHWNRTAKNHWRQSWTKPKKAQ